jgi:hypothetical protein
VVFAPKIFIATKPI